jgi:phosphoribosylaminoimidazolecarboxamide formyltransferase / IMP cyclohydrolase
MKRKKVHMENTGKKRRIFISVFDKTGLEKFRKLVLSGWEIISSSGTATALKNMSIPCIEVSDVTGFPEMLDGRVKTMHPKIQGGVLFERAVPKHVEQIKENGIEPIDAVVCNLYPFEKEPCIDNIDVGGPTIIRAAAKNAASVAVVVDPADYDEVIDRLINDGEVSRGFANRLAAKAFSATASYDRMIADWHIANTEKGIDSSTVRKQH